MFPRDQRIKKTLDFDRLFKNGGLVRGELADIRWRANGLGENRFGFVTSLAVSKKAVARNRIRRLLASFAGQMSLLPKEAFDILIIAKPKIIGRQPEEIKNDIQRLFKKAKLVD